MRVAETSGRTVEEAIGRALNQLGLNRDQVDVDVVTEGKAGFLGFGSEDAIVRVTAKDSVATTGGQRRRGGGGGAASGGGPGAGGGRRDEGTQPRQETDDGGEGRRRRRGRRGGRRRGGDRPEGAAAEAGGEQAAAEAGAPDAGTPDAGGQQARPERSDDRRRGGGRDRGGRRNGRNDRGERSERPERRSVPVAERVRGVPDDELISIPGVPDDIPIQPPSDAEDEIDLAGSTIRDILTLLGLTGTEISARDPETPGDGAGLIAQVFDIFGEDDDVADELGLLIGRRGETLSSLQYLVNTIVAKSGDDAPIYSIDIEGYKRRRERTLVEMAKEIAQEVRETGDVITLEPMPAHERRIIHLALEDEPGVRTESVGSGDRRQVEVLPEDE